ncbi:MAG: pyridoxal phosphate-dependent aminotransferase [Euryarchaeota archaeon]|nr:pyridoxal phosphate-dependent aminotransferase [Euryarchaeota archaeon]
MGVSGRVSILRESATLKLLQKAKEMMAKGIDVITLNLGEPDFDTPEIIKRGAVEALEEGKTKYTPSQGILELREKIAEYYKNQYNVEISSKNIIIAPTKYLIYASLIATLDLSDRVLIPDPGWVSYKWQAYLAGLKCSYYQYDEEGNPLIEVIEDSFKSTDTKGIIINTPSNPLGTIMGVSYMEDIYEIVEDQGGIIIADEIYEGLVFEGRHISFAQIDPEFKHTIIISGFSKLFAMTGWRIGWALASEDVIKAMNKIIQHTITCVTSFVQYGALKAFTEEAFEENRKMVEAYRRRRDIVIKEIKDLGWTAPKPKATFYIFPKYNSEKPSTVIADEILEKAHVALVPGVAFGPSGEYHLRISYATSESSLREAFRRIKEIWNEIS